ncbi:TATA element modulatory factor [Papilio xuthus]|uniref:TATA element modulatory factor n=1 Tax=Papilio xuthus TaxID=66420 RepID=A0A194PVW1_PAPXU|nr:TATA element modulatory factor [Papilio xuthus]
MNWFDTSGLTSLAKTALKEAQKTIDKALDITDESSEEPDDEPVPIKPTKSLSSGNTPQKDSSDFFSSWGLTVSAESSKDPIKEQPVVTESPSKSNSQSLWGSFAGSFFEQQQQQKASENESAIVRPPKAKSMTVIADSKYDSQDDLFSRSQLVMSDGADCLDTKKDDLISKFDNRRNSSLSHRLSLVSSRNSSDSVEVLSHSLKTTPDSEVSVHTISNSSSAGQKQTSESVEILPDSLISPSSIECLGFDSYASDKNSSTSSNLSPGDLSDKKSTPIGEATEKAETADSVSLVADDDEDTMSYNSISECTAPTVLDTDEKPISPFPKPKNDTHKKVTDKDPTHLEHPILSQKMQISENSSNDGSWSDRTLNADNDSVILEATEDNNKEVDHEDSLMEKLSDSSSFYNVNVTTDLLRSESSTFVNIEKQQSSAPGSSESSQKESIKERTSPISSDSKSDLVKIGSDRTSGHTSGDEVETATSSDIEIIPSPNGDNGHSFCRSSPGKYNFKQGKFDGTTSPNLVDLVLGKSLATKIRGHTRELSETSVQSNTSDESQGSENDRLMRRLCEMAEILDARESRLMEVSRSNAELIESNTNLKSQMESLLAKHDAGDINLITEDYTQRMSALEKKFQQAIREKDQLRKELDKLKTEATRKGSSELEEGIKERDEVIAQLQEEGEQLSRQQLHHSNIIKKLRAKDKDNEQVIKGLRDKIAELSSELDRAKRAAAAKEELEVSQIEAVYRLTTANKKMETELVETRSALEDTLERLESARTSLEGARRELAELRHAAAEAERARTAAHDAHEHCQRAQHEADTLRAQLHQLRLDRTKEEQRWRAREEALRQEAAEAREAAAGGAAGGAAAGEGAGQGAGALLAQLAALQRSALERERAHSAAAAARQRLLEEAQTGAAKAGERERLAREEAAGLRARLAAAEEQLEAARAQHRDLSEHCQRALHAQRRAELDLADKAEELGRVRAECEASEAALRERLQQLETQLQTARLQLDTERKRSEILQVVSACLSRFTRGGGAGGAGGAVSALGVEDALAAVSRREGSARAMAGTLAALRTERTALRNQLAELHAQLQDHQSLQEQYDALLQMYGEKEEQLAELRLDLQDVTHLYKAQLDELVTLRGQQQQQQR